MSKTVDAFITEIDNFLAATGMSEAAFGTRYMRDPSYVSRLRTKRNTTFASADKVRAGMAEYWAEAKSKSSRRKPADAR